MKKLGVVIPTYNRKEKLFYVLLMLQQQNLSKREYEITVVDDGSTDGTKEAAEGWKKEFGFEFTLITQKNKKQGAARNRGVKETETEYILFLGDDIVPRGEDFLAIYLRALESTDGKTGFLGFTTWHASILPDRFRVWLENGAQFDYGSLKAHEETDYWHFYTSNIALPRKLLVQEKFDEKFGGYGYEDIELGYRLQKAGLRLLFLPEASAGHLHAVTETEFFARLGEVKKTAEYFQKKHPEVAVLPAGFKLRVLQILTWKPVRKALGFLRKEWGWWAEYKSKMM